MNTFASESTADTVSRITNKIRKRRMDCVPIAVESATVHAALATI